MAQETIDFPSQFPDKANPDYRDVFLGYDSQSGQPISVRLETLQANSATNIIGVAHPTDSPTGTELNGQGYDVSNTSGAEQTFTNFLTNVPDGEGGFVPVKLPDGKSGVIRKSGGRWEFVPNAVDLSGLMSKSQFVETVSVNMIDESLIDFAHRYSKASKTIINRDSQIAAGPRVKVAKGESYTFSGNGLYIHTDGLPQAGYFANGTTSSAVANVDFSPSTDGLGWEITVPDEYDSYLVICNLNTTADHDFTGFQVMMNKGDSALPYEVYNPKDQILESALPPVSNTSLSEKEVLAITRQKSVFTINLSAIWQRMKPFIINFLERDKNGKDIEFLLLGDSIFGKNINYTLYPLEVQQTRPATLISKSIAGGIWDKINDGCTKFARWDKSGVFTESAGSGWTSYFGYALKPAWDDAGDREAETREFIGTGAASTAFKFEAGNKRLNLVYRTSSEGCDTLTIMVAEGSGKELVYDRPSGTWVEANGYAFSQLYTASGTGYGNTEFGRVLKFKKVSAEVANEHTITISKPVTSTAQSLMYWGIEQSNRDYIMRIRNVARGGHDMKMLWQYVRTEFDNFDTDFVLFEIPIINMLNNTPTINPYGFWTNADYGIQPKLLGADANSLKSISAGFTKFQVVPTLLLDSNISRFNPDGTLKEYTYGDTVYTVDSYFDYLSGKFWENSDQIGFLNVWHWFKENCIQTFGNLYTALSESPADSKDSYIHIGHPNDLGAENILMYLTPLFDFHLN